MEAQSNDSPTSSSHGSSRPTGSKRETATNSGAVAFEDIVGLTLGEAVTIVFTIVIALVYLLAALGIAELTSELLRATDLMIGFITGRIAAMPGPQNSQ